MMETGALTDRLRALGSGKNRSEEGDSALPGTPLTRRFQGLMSDLASQQRERAAETAQRRAQQRARGGRDNLPHAF